MSYSVGRKASVVKASFSVEGAWIFSICIIIIYLVISFSFDLYSDVYATIDETKIEESDAVRSFRLVQAGKELFDIK